MRLDENRRINMLLKLFERYLSSRWNTFSVAQVQKPVRGQNETKERLLLNFQMREI